MATKRSKATLRPRRDTGGNAKQEQLAQHREVPDEQLLTTDQGLRITTTRTH